MRGRDTELFDFSDEEKSGIQREYAKAVFHRFALLVRDKSLLGPVVLDYGDVRVELTIHNVK